MQYSDNPIDSWHARLAEPLETWALWEYHSGNGNWLSQPDYSTQDRIAKTLL